MKIKAVAVVGMLLAGTVQAKDINLAKTSEEQVCYSLNSTPAASTGAGFSATVTPQFYISSVRDVKECRKIATAKGAHVIIDPNG